MTDLLTPKAKRRYLDERSKSRNPKLCGEENFLTESYQFKFFSEKSDKYENTLYDEADLYKDEREEAQIHSCRRIFEQHLKIFENWNVEDLLPRGNSLCDLLFADQTYTKSWLQPNLIREGCPVVFEHCVVNVRGFSEKKLLSAYSKYKDALLTQCNNVYSAMHFPVFVQTMKIPRSAYFELLQAKADGKVSHTITVNADDTSVIDVPVGITFSDGYSFSFTIKFPWERIPTDTNGLYVPTSQSFAYTFCNMPRPLVNFLNQAPIMYTDNAEQMIKLLESFFIDFFKYKYVIKAFDLGSLAVAAGCRMDSMDIFSLATVCNGLPFPVGIETMDQRWAWSTSETQNDVIWTYLEQRIKHMSQIYLALMGSLLRQLFPDPDITLYALRMTQESFIRWFSYFVATALVDTSIDDTSGLGDAKSRAELLRLIKSGSSPHLEQLADLYSSVPVPQCGGERYLHHARSVFVEQFSVLERIHLQGFLWEQPTPRPDILDKKYELLYRREYVLDDSGTPCYYTGLQPSPQFAGTMYELDLEGATSYKVQSLKPMHGRQIIPAICEWVRLNHTTIHHFMGRLEGLSTDDLKDFWIEHIRAYDYMRACMLRVLNLRSGVRALDLVLAKRQDNTRDHLAQVALSNPGKKGNERLDLLEDTVHHDTDDRVGLVQSVYEAIPGSNNKENRRKAFQRKQRQKEYMRNNPEALSNRDYHRAKKMRVMNEVAVRVGERRIVNDPVASLPKRAVSIHSECAPSSSRSEGNAVVIPDDYDDHSQRFPAQAEANSYDESVYSEGDADTRQEDLPLRRLSDQDARYSLSRMNPTYEFDNLDRHRMPSGHASWRRRRGGYNPRNYH